MSGSKEEAENRYYGVEDGIVVRNDDPEGLGRVTIRIAGIIEETSWALPLSVGGGSRGRGLFMPPEVGADVAVWFHRGDPHGTPKYLPGHWGRGEQLSPLADVPPADVPKIQVLESERWTLTLDNRAGKQALRIRDKVSGDMLELDGVRRRMSLNATGRLQIRGGSVDIVGARVTINGRPVSPTGGPI